MKKLCVSLIFILSFVFSFAQPKVQRSTGSNTVVDQRIAAGLNLYVPAYADTTTANLTTPNNNIGIDSCGAQIFTYDVMDYWVRKCSPKRWARVSGNSSLLLPQCGLQSGTGVVTWDSLLVFDVSAARYALCCDNIQRTSAFDSVKLEPSDPTNPRYDAIILDANGVNYVKGTASANPAIPQTTSCQIVLTYVLINAGDAVPADITTLSIYDQNLGAPTEWPGVATGVTVNLDNLVTPLHLTKAADLGAFTNGQSIKFTSTSVVNLSNYNVLKFYIKLKAVWTGSNKMTIGWLNGGLFASTYVDMAAYGFNPNYTGGYQVISIPMTAWVFKTTNVTAVNFILSGSNTGIYLDWIQLQAGFFPNTSPGTVTNVSSGNLTDLFDVTVYNPTTTPAFVFSKQSVPAYTVYLNQTNATAAPIWDTLDLSTPIVTGLLPVTKIAPGTANQVLTTIGGVATWTTGPTGYDTTRTINGISAFPGTLEDTIGWGGRTLGSRILDYDTHLGMGNFHIKFEQGNDIVFLIDPIGKSSYLRQTNGTTSEAVLGAESDFSGGNVFFNLRSVHATDTVNVRGDAISKKLTVTVDSILFKSTLGPAVTGYVWTLKDAATGSGYWAVSGAGSGVPINTLLAATGTNTINNANFGQEWQWNTLAATTALGLTSTSTAATGNSQVLFSSSLSGANATAGQITKAAYIINSHTGATSQNYAGDFRATNGTTNVAGYFSASAGTNNYAIIVPNSGGRVGIGNSAPDSLLHLTGGLHTVSGGVRFESLPAGGVAADSVLVVTSTGIVKKRDAASFGGGAVTTIYTGDGTLAGNRVVDQNSNSLSFTNTSVFNVSAFGSNSFFKIDPSNLIFQIGDIDGYDAGTKIVIDDAQNKITLTAATHTFTGNVGIGATPTVLFQVQDGGNTLVSINKTTFNTLLKATDGTANSILELSGDLTGTSVYFDLIANDGSNFVDIYGDAIAQTITHTANQHIFNTDTSAFGIIVTNATSGGSGIRANVLGSGSGVDAFSPDGYGVIGYSTNGIGVTGLSENNIAGIFESTNASLSAVVGILEIDRSYQSGTPLAGMGGSINFAIRTEVALHSSNSLISKWTNATDATAESQFIITGVTGGSGGGDIIYFEGNGRTRFNGRSEFLQGADVASAAGAIALGLDGNVFEITGTASITLISNLNWQNGSEITLLFTSTAVLVDGTANSGTDIGMELNGNANFSATAGDAIKLVLSEIGGTQRWRQSAAASIN